MRLLPNGLILNNWARAAGFAAILISAIVCTFVWVISYPPVPCVRPQTQHYDSYANAERSAPQQKPNSSYTIKSQINGATSDSSACIAYRNEQERLQKAANERGLTVATWILAFATVFLFVGVVVQAGLFVWQLYLMREGMDDAKIAANAANNAALAAKTQSDIMQQQFIASHPARIIVRNMRISYITPIEEDSDDKEPIDVEISFYCINIGETSGIIHEIEATIVISKTNKPLNREIALDKFLFRPKTVNPLDLVITIVRKKFAHEYWEFIKSDAISLCCVGTIRYEDGRGVTRQVGFARKLDLETGRFGLIDDEEYEYSY